MSAAEIIKQIKALPATEQAQVLNFVDELRERSKATTSTTAESIEAVADRVFTRYEPLFRKLAE